MLRSLHEVETRLSSSETYLLHVKTPEIFKHQFLSAFIFWSGANRQNFMNFMNLRRLGLQGLEGLLPQECSTWVMSKARTSKTDMAPECSEYLIMLTCTACTFSSFSCTLFHFETVYDSCSLQISKSTNLASLSYPEFPGACFATSYLPCVDSRQWGPLQGNPALQ